jgi:protein-disulfide isomerase
MTARQAPLKALGTAAFAALTLAGPAAGFDVTAMTVQERAAFREEIRAYLLDNPEVLMEAIAVLEERQAADQAANDTALIAANADALFDDGYSWVGGNPDGDVTIVEFSDYRCGYCRRAHPEVEELLSSDGNIRFILKEFPILGEASVISSRFAIATKMVAGDAAYKQVHDALIELRADPTEETLDAIATEAGLDADAIFVEMANPEIDRIIAENRALAQRLQINGTPTFVMGDQMYRGYLPLDAMREVVAAIRADG